MKNCRPTRLFYFVSGGWLACRKVRNGLVACGKGTEIWVKMQKRASNEESVRRQLSLGIGEGQLVRTR